VLAAAGASPDDVCFRYGLDARYAGQGNEVTVWVGEGGVWPAEDAAVIAAFEREYRQIFGMTIPDVAVEVVTWRLSVTAESEDVEPALAATGAGAKPFARRPVVFERNAAAVDTPVYRRGDLGAGATFAGPAIVEERETTAVIRPGWSVEVAADGTLIATREDRA
jgi:N-methylhydantoinase A